MIVLLSKCDACGVLEERTFRDSWTGKELCPECLSEVLNEVTCSPATEGDNFIELLVEKGLLDEEEAE